MKFTPTAIDGAYIIDVDRHGDARGYFCETFRKNELERALGYAVDWVQDNESCSGRGVVRGMHWQAGEHAQAKLVRVVHGSIVDIIVDLRQSSMSFGKHVAVNLSAGNGRQLFIPRGCAHGFAVLEDDTVFLYKVDNYWNPDAERGFYPYDAALELPWPFDKTDALLSPRDADRPSFSEAEKEA